MARQWLHSSLDALSFLDSKRATVQPRTLGAYLYALRRWHEYRALPDPTCGTHIRVPPLKPQPVYSEDERQRLYAACRTPQERALVTLLDRTGMRSCEARSLTWAESDFVGGTATIRGKGGRCRTLVFDDAVLAALSAYRNGTGFMFPSRLGGAISYGRLRQIMRVLGKRAGVAASAHKFRRSYAVRFLEYGGDAGALRWTLGHSTLTMALHYASWTEARRALAQQRRLSLADRL